MNFNCQTFELFGTILREHNQLDNLRLSVT